MIEHATQEAGIGIMLIIAVGFALLARLLFKPKPGQIIKDSKPNSPTQRGAFIPLVVGTRKVGAVIAYVGDRRTTQEEIPGGGKGLGPPTPTQTVYHEKGIHLLCVGPAYAIHGIFADGKRIPGSDSINKFTHPSGTSITFPDFGTMRIYWGELSEHPLTDSILNVKLGIATKGPYVCRIEWDDYRLGVGTTWPILEYIIEVAPCAPTDLIGTPTLHGGINPGLVLHQIAIAKYPHGAGTPVEWWDMSTLVDIGDLAVTERVSMNLLIEDGDSADRTIANLMQDMGFLLAECEGVLHLVPMRKYEGAVQTLDNDVLVPPIESIEKVHISVLGDQLIYAYIDKDQNYRNGTIDIDDDSVGQVRNQRKAKTIKLETITVREVAGRIANRRQVEDLDPPTGVKAKGLRGLRGATVGQPFELPGIGRVRLLGYKLEFKEPTIMLDLLKDPFDQAIIDFEDPGLPGGGGIGTLLPDIRFDAIELNRLISGGVNAIVVFRHRHNDSIYFADVLASADDITYLPVGTQNKASAGGVLASSWDALTSLSIVEEGPLITIDSNGDENLPLNLSGVLASWYSGSQIMMIGNDSDYELFYVREFEEVVADVSFRPKGLIRNIGGTGYKLFTPYDDPHPYKVFDQDQPCYIISASNITPATSGSVALNGAKYIKSTPGNSDGIIPAGAVIADELGQLSLGTVTPKIAWVTWGGTFGAPVHRRDKTYKHDGIDPADGTADVLEGIGITFQPTITTQGAGMQGAGQPVAVPSLTGNYKLLIYGGVDSNDFVIEDMIFGLLATITDTLESLLQNDDGTVTLILSRATLDAMWIGSLLGVDLFNANPSDRAGAGIGVIWTMMLYHTDGTESQPVEIRPHSLTVPAEQWIPLSQQ